VVCVINWWLSVVVMMFVVLMIVLMWDGRVRRRVACIGPKMGTKWCFLRLSLFGGYVWLSVRLGLRCCRVCSLVSL